MAGSPDDARVRPTVLQIDLGELARRAPRADRAPCDASNPPHRGAPNEAVLVARSTISPVPWRASDAAVDRVGSWSGSALATAIVFESQRAHPHGPAPFVVTVGECVRHALPTAARATVASIAPASGLYADGQVGSDFGRRLASLADALRLQGHVDCPGAVLRLDRDVHGVWCELWSFPSLVGADPELVQRALSARFGPCAVLRVGRAGERGLPFASLAAGSDPPSFVGRGGLGAVFGRLGLKALAIGAQPVEERASDGARALLALLSRSPRLAARAEGGTFELFDALAARGDGRARNYAAPLTAAVAQSWSTSARALVTARKGCRGCPTPCGFVFEHAAMDPARDESSTKQGGRFSALHALGPNLGLHEFDAALELLAACDAGGIDAKEVGAALALACVAQGAGRLPEIGLEPGALWGNRSALATLIDEALTGRGVGARLAHGAHALASEFGLADRVFEVKGQAVRPESNLAVLLGQCASSRGGDPMRANPFLVGTVDRARLAALMAPLSIPSGAEDPLDPAGKGRIVWWHENLMNAIDASGFCAFAASGLIADGVCSIDELAQWIAPAALRGRECSTRSLGVPLMAAGASIAALQRALNARLGARFSDDLPEFARSRLEHASVWPEYAALRGLDEEGGVTSETWSRLGRDSILDTQIAFSKAACGVAGVARTAEGAGVRRPSAVRIRSFGPLAERLGADARFELMLPLPLAAVLNEIERGRPAASGALVRTGGEIVPAVYRATRRLECTDLVNDGDELDFVVALSGG